MKRANIRRLLAALLALFWAVPFMTCAMAEAGVTEAWPQAVVLGVGEKLQLTPDMVKDVVLRDVVFKSSRPNTVSVSKKGLITARRTGTAKVGIGVGKTLLGVCEITVKPAPKRIDLSDGRLLLTVGDSARLTAALPDGTASAIRFASSAASVATVTADGRVAAVGAGRATVTASTFNGKKAKCEVYVLGGPSPESLALSVMSIVVGVGDSLPVQPYIQMDEGADAFFAFATQDRRIATVSATGQLTGKKAGKTKLGVKTHNGLTAFCQVEVLPAPKSISLDIKDRMMGLGGTYLLRVTPNPWQSYTTLTFTSSDKGVATVDENGRISAVAPGKCTITVKTHNGKKASCAITVKNVKEF